jgi:hypothetical protein
MANYYGYSRSNYFKVKNKEKFKEFLNQFNGFEYIEDDKGLSGWLIDTEYGGHDTTIYDEETEDYIEDINFEDELSKHLKKGQVAIYQEIGYEKLRYLTGYSVAVNWEGKVETVGIDDIYNIANTVLGGEDVTMAHY